MIKKHKIFSGILFFFLLLDTILLGILIWFATIDRTREDFSIKQFRYLMVYLAIFFSSTGFIFGIYEVIDFILLR